MTTTLTHVTTGSAFSRAVADVAPTTEDGALGWVARQLRFERLLRTLEEESTPDPANPSSELQ